MVIYVDTGDIAQLQKYAQDRRIGGITTNPTLLLKAGIKSYRNLATIILGLANGKPVSFEVLSDEWDEIERQVIQIASWGQNVYVKVPVTNTRGEPCTELVRRMPDYNLNITAVMATSQLAFLDDVVQPHHIVSIFAGRIADTGRDPCHIMQKARSLNAKILWASAREVFNVYQAESCKCDIITLSPELIGKLDLYGKPLEQYSLETVQQFFSDGQGVRL